MEFTKMHGLGNDYIYINCFKEKINNPKVLSIKLSNRNFGIGSDGLVLILPSKKNNFKMRMFNNDGTEGEMCGNAIRCLGKYVYDNNLTNKNIISVETASGVKIITLNIKNKNIKDIKVDMGEPIMNTLKNYIHNNKDFIINEPIKIDNKIYKITYVSMGNPHIVIYKKNIENLNLENLGPKFEFNRRFPNRINIEFVEIVDKNNLKMRVWERGSGETLACGTGACAVLVSSVLNKISKRNATIILKGGKLFIEWKKTNNHVYMTGPAVTVFKGTINI